MATATESHITTALAAVPGWDMQKVTRRKLDGGLLNSNWLVNHDGEDFFVKIFGVGSENFVNRQLSFDAASKANGLNISPGIVFFDENLGIEVFQFLNGYRSSTNADFARRDFMAGAIELYRQFNSCDPLPVTKDVFAMTDEHIEQGDEIGAIRPADYGWLLHQYGRAKQAFMASGLDLAPCHNDPMPGNFMVRMSGDDSILDMKLIDFEFASNNERAYEIGVFLGEIFADEDATLEMIERFYGALRPDLVARTWVARAVADMKWGSWAVQQRQLSSWDFDYQKYGIWKYGRARALFNDPRWNYWLSKI